MGNAVCTDQVPDFFFRKLQLPYFTDYKTHFFLQKIASKIQVRLILEINIKMSSV
jgi:hypothetical protein